MLKTKQLAERTAASLDYATLTEFFIYLIQNHAPQVLQEHVHIQLSHTQFEQFAAVKLAVSPQQRQNDMFTEVLGGISLAQQPERYVELTQAKNQIQQRALPLKELEQYNPKTDVEKALAKYPKADAWLPLKANAIDMVVLVNKESASIIKIVDLRPWK